MQNDENNVFLLSFTDALTCVFGAAIALFLIFVVLVKLAPADTSPAAGGTSARLQLRAALSTERAAGISTAVITVVTTECAVANGLALKGPSSFKVEHYDIKHTGQDADSCARLFRLSNGVPEAGVTLISLKKPNKSLHLVLEVGGAVWPGSGAWSLTVPTSRYCREDRSIARLMSKLGAPVEPMIC